MLLLFLDTLSSLCHDLGLSPFNFQTKCTLLSPHPFNEVMAVRVSFVTSPQNTADSPVSTHAHSATACDEMCSVF